MLEPTNRSLLSEMLRPPIGFALEHAVGTTFTLDLPSVLPIPLAFAAAQGPDDDPIGILAALSQTTNRIDVFCQAGAIAVPASSGLLPLIEPVIHPVVPARGALFHPKVWMLHFRRDEAEKFRLLVGSRNLTRDTTWDAVAAFDGEPASDLPDGQRRGNEDIRSLLHWLSQHSQPRLSQDRLQRIGRLAARWGDIRWELPAGVNELTFRTLGIGRQHQADAQPEQALIVSPFVSESGLRHLSGRTRTVLLSRVEQIDRLPPRALENVELRVLDDAAELPVSLALNSEPTGPLQPLGSPLRGLHAKVAIHDRSGGTSRVLLGSANATSAGWTKNVEVLAELTGATKQVGVDATLQAMGELLQEHHSEGGDEASEEEAALRALEHVLLSIATLELEVAFGGEGPYTATVTCATSFPFDETPALVELSWRFIASPAPFARGALRIGDGFSQTVRDIAELTPFVVVEARDQGGNRASAVLVARVARDIVGRRERAFLEQLDSPAAFARFLQLMLGADSGAAVGGSSGAWSAWASVSRVDGHGNGLLEVLLRSMGRRERSIEDLDRILQRMTPAERERVLPDGFWDLWSNVRAAEARS